jgi:hypothetical protein
MIKKKVFNRSRGFVLIFILLIFVFLSGLLFHFFSKRELSLQWTQDIPDKINCHTISYSGDLVSVGTESGICYVYNQAGNKVFERKFPFPILALKFSYNNAFLYVKGESLLAIELANQKIWEKFKKGYIVEDFWVFRDGRCSVLMHSRKDITLVYQYLDQRGMTTKEFVLPEIFGNYSCCTSVDGKYFFLSLQEGDLYLFQSDGIVVWNLHLDPPVKEISTEYPAYPIFQSVTKNGSVFLAYSAEEYGKDLFVAQLIDNKSNTVWEKSLPSPISGLMISPDEKKILISTQNKIVVDELSGKNLYTIDQFGYKPKITKLGTTNILVGFVSSEISSDIAKNALVFKLISLSRNHVLWQKKTGNDVVDFSIAKNGYVFVEISQHIVKFFRYVLQ